MNLRITNYLLFASKLQEALSDNGIKGMLKLILRDENMMWLSVPNESLMLKGLLKDPYETVLFPTIRFIKNAKKYAKEHVEYMKSLEETVLLESLLSLAIDDVEEEDIRQNILNGRINRVRETNSDI